MSALNDNLMVECENLVKIYKTSEIEVVALQGLDLSIEKGETVAVIGNSGSGKSTLLNMLGALDKPSAGRLCVDGSDITTFGYEKLIKYKRETVGFVWQNNARNLIPYLTALENVELPLIISGKRQRRERSKELIDIVGLSHRGNNKLLELSGGEQQRVAIAISLANNPRLLLADEPTGSVDTKTADIILDIFRNLSRSFGTTIVIVTHDLRLSKKVDRVVAIRDGRTSSEFIRKVSYRDELDVISDKMQENSEDSHVELAVIDKAGRLQIPRDYLDSIKITGPGKARVELENGRIVIYPPQ